MTRLFLLLLVWLPAILASNPRITLNHGGTLIGNLTETVSGRKINAFKGIPYAKSPVGDLRFKSPQPYPSWQGERSAINESAICFQVEASAHQTAPMGQEDCLYLNVYVPTTAHRHRKPLPVMVWFHGGGWTYGNGGGVDYGPQYLLDKDVILVAGNYRLNIFGFLSSETLECPGNFGLKDQVEILKWVNQHISSFGGDPASVTIFGESAGSMSVMYLMHSDKSNKLFSQAIAQSGTYFNLYGHERRKGVAAEKALRLARLVSCTTGDEVNWKQLIDCLRGLPADTLIREYYKFFLWEFFPTVPLLAVIEDEHKDAFLTSDPRNSSSSLNIPLMLGFNAEEGALFAAPILNTETILTDLKSNFSNLLPLMMQYDHLGKERQNEVTQAIEGFYLKNGQDYNIFNFKNFTQIITDGMFFHGFDQFLRQRASQPSSTTYAYLFNHKGEKSLTSILGGGSKFFGVAHADELQYIFQWHHILNSTEPPPFRDLMMRKAMVDMWTDFAICGNPTPRWSKYSKWNKVDGLPWNYAVIGSKDPEEKRIIKNEKSFIKDRIEFWNSLMI